MRAEGIILPVTNTDSNKATIKDIFHRTGKMWP